MGSCVHNVSTMNHIIFLMECQNMASVATALKLLNPTNTMGTFLIPFHLKRT
ncbi:hypothetical protein LC724_32040 [Blautia sp. RD014234]|nr:hypothetical protein [Blautia parvula]